MYLTISLQNNDIHPAVVTQAALGKENKKVRQGEINVLEDSQKSTTVPRKIKNDILQPPKKTKIWYTPVPRKTKKWYSQPQGRPKFGILLSSGGPENGILSPKEGQNLAHPCPEEDQKMVHRCPEEDQNLIHPCPEEDQKMVHRCPEEDQNLVPNINTYKHINIKKKNKPESEKEVFNFFRSRRWKLIEKQKRSTTTKTLVGKKEEQLP